MQGFAFPLKKTKITSNESFFHLLGIQSKIFDYYDLGLINTWIFASKKVPKTDKDVLAEVYFDLSLTSSFKVRNSYNLLMVFSDVGGVQFIFALIGAFLSGSFAEFSFTLKAIEELFTVQTKDFNLFKPISAHREQQKEMKTALNSVARGS